MRRRAVAALLAALAAGPLWAGSYEDFFKAIEVDDGSTVMTLLLRGFDPNTLDAAGQHGLFLALRGGAVRVLDTLWAHPQLAVDVANAKGETPLMMAALRGQRAWAQRLIERGARVNRLDWGPLHYAAAGPEPAVVALLLERGAVVDASSPNGTTALMMAAGYGPEASVDLLLAAGADVQRRNEVDLDAAAFARRAGRDELARRLAAAR